MTDDQRLIPLHEPDDFLAAIPALIGMVPGEGTAIIVLLNTDAEVKLTLMVPMNDAAMNDAIRHVRSFDPDEHGMILTFIAEDLEDIRYALSLFGDNFPVPLSSMFFVQAFEVGAPYAEVILHHMGTVPDFMTSQLTAEAIASGRQVNRSIADIAALYRMTEPSVEAKQLEEGEIGPTLLELGEAVNAYRSYDPAKVGGLLIFSTTTRDHTLNVAYISAPAAHTVFAEASRVLRGPARVEALSAAGLSAYLDGEGVMARHALNAAKSTAADCDPIYEPELAMMLDEALDQGIHPQEIANSVFAELYEEEDKRHADRDPND